METYEKYILCEDGIDRFNKTFRKNCIKEFVEEYLKGKNKSKSISYDDLLAKASKWHRCHFSKDDLPEIQGQIEDEGFEIYYDE